MTIEEKLREICSNLGGKAYAVGGSVRDEVLSLIPKDKDFLITGIELESLTEALSRAGDVNVVGKSFGVVKFRPTGETATYDIALPRTEKYYGEKHTDVTVSYNKDLPVGDDLCRRDLTINAIAKDLVTGRYIDPFGGLFDIRHKIIKPPHFNSFLEDPLRLLRAVQFAARLRFTTGPYVEEQMRQRANSLASISAERIATELIKLFRASKPSVGLDLMQRTGILKQILPEVDALVGIPQPAKFHILDAYHHSTRVCDMIPWKRQVYLRITGLLHDIGKATTYTNTDGEIHFYAHDKVGAEMAKGLLDRLKFYAVDGVYFPTDRVITLIKEHMFECNIKSPDKNIQRFVRKLGKHGAFDQIRLRIGDSLGGRAEGSSLFKNTYWVDFAKKVRALSAPKKGVFDLRALAVNGNDLISIGFKSGPDMGRVLKELLNRAFEQPELNTREQLLEIAKNELERSNKEAE